MVTFKCPRLLPYLKTAIGFLAGLYPQRLFGPMVNKVDKEGERRLEKAQEMFVLYLYGMVSLVIIITAWMSAGLRAGICALITSLVAVFAGTRLRGSFHFTKYTIVSELAVAIIFLVIAEWVGQGFSVRVFGYEFAGSNWGWLGFILCFSFTPKRVALGIFEIFG